MDRSRGLDIERSCACFVGRSSCSTWPASNRHQRSKGELSRSLMRLRLGKSSQAYFMSFYAKYILPRIIDLAMRNKETTRLRAESVPRASGDVLEIGIGSGRNLPFYSPEVKHVYGVDPSLELQRMAREKQPAGPTKVDFFTQSADEPIP